MAIEGLNTLTQQLAKSPRGTDRCEAGCMVFDGGERKHHRDCVHYPESLTKLWHDTEAGYVAEIERLRVALDPFAFALKAARQRLGEHPDINDVTALACRFISYEHLKTALSEVAQRERIDE